MTFKQTIEMLSRTAQSKFLEGADVDEARSFEPYLYQEISKMLFATLYASIDRNTSENTKSLLRTISDELNYVSQDIHELGITPASGVADIFGCISEKLKRISNRLEWKMDDSEKELCMGIEIGWSRANQR